LRKQKKWGEAIELIQVATFHKKRFEQTGRASDKQDYAQAYLVISGIITKNKTPKNWFREIFRIKNSNLRNRGRVQNTNANNTNKVYPKPKKQFVPPQKTGRGTSKGTTSETLTCMHLVTDSLTESLMIWLKNTIPKLKVSKNARQKKRRKMNPAVTKLKKCFFSKNLAPLSASDLNNLENLKKIRDQFKKLQKVSDNVAGTKDALENMARLFVLGLLNPFMWPMRIAYKLQKYHSKENRLRGLRPDHLFYSDRRIAMAHARALVKNVDTLIEIREKEKEKETEEQETGEGKAQMSSK